MGLQKLGSVIVLFVSSAALMWTMLQKSNQDQGQLTLILNSENSVGVLPRNFRICRNPWQRKIPENQRPPSRIGLDTLNASGSGQFSENGLSAILSHLSTQPIIIVDLREESHGFANGIAVSWFAPRDTANVGKTLAQIEDDESERLKNLLVQRNVTIEHIISKPNDVIAKTQPINLIVETVATEKQLVKKHHVSYMRIPVTDHLPPSKENVQRFMTFIDSLPPNVWLHFHCEAGDGRTTTFLCLYDMIRNGKNVSFQDIIERQYLLGGMNLEEMPSATSWKYSHAKDRIKFLENFYRSLQ